jgi:hypothetical protein
MKFYSVSTAGAYTVPEILECEREILKRLNWKIQYANLAYWANYITSKWDSFVDNCHSFESSQKLPKFRNKTNEEYKLFRKLFQILDLITLDLEMLKYSNRYLVSSVIYLLLGIYLNYFSIKEIILDFVNDKNAFIIMNFVPYLIDSYLTI